MFRTIILAVATVLAAGALAGCSETVSGNPIAPRQDSATATAALPTPSSPPTSAVGDQMAKVRAADACTLFDRGLAEQLGTFQRFDRKKSWTGCSMFIADDADPGSFYEFSLGLDEGATTDSSTRLPEQVAGQTVYRDFLSNDDKPNAYGCLFFVPAGQSGRSYSLGTSHLAPPKNKPVPWSRPCEYTRGYLAAIMDNLKTLPPHPIDGAGENSLIQKNPCLNEQKVLAASPPAATSTTTAPPTASIRESLWKPTRFRR